MAQYDGINVTLSSLNFIKPAIKNATEVNLTEVNFIKYDC